MSEDTSLTLFDDWLHETYVADTSIGNVTLVRSDDDFANFRDWLFSTQRPLAYDIEATGLDIFPQLGRLRVFNGGIRMKRLCSFGKSRGFSDLLIS